MPFIMRAVLIIIVSTAMALANVPAAAANKPRAWLVKKGDAQAVLVGESHFGTPSEDDRYFKTVVEPSHRVAEVAIMETYFGPDQRLNEAFEVGAPCFDQEKSAPTERIEFAFADLVRAVNANHLEMPIWLEDWKVVPDFFFISIYLDWLKIAALGNSYDHAIEAQGGPGISFRLRAASKVSKKNKGLDTLKDRRDNFCNASIDERADYLADYVMQASSLLWLKQSDPSYTSVSQLAILSGRLFEATLACVDREVPCEFGKISVVEQTVLRGKGWIPPFSTGTFAILFKKRNQAWVPRIAKAVLDHRRSFIIVGSMHLPDLRVGNRVEPGLINLLRKQGFSVTSIGGVSDISATFLAPSWSDRMRAILSSL